MARKTVLETINDNSLVLYYLLNKKKIKIDTLYQAVLSKNKNIVLEQVTTVSSRQIDNLHKNYTKEDCFDEILFLTDNRYRHLKEIRNIVSLDDFIQNMITDKIYLEKVNIHYTDLIIDKLIEAFYDYKSLCMFSKMRQKLILLDHNTNKKILDNIDHFYIQKITI